MVEAHRTGVLPRANVCDFCYKRRHPSWHRARKRAATGLRRWRRRWARLQGRLPPVSPVRLFDPDPSIFPSLAVRIALAPVVVPLTLAMLGGFGIAYVAGWVWRRPVLAVLDRHRRRVCARACRQEGLA